MKSLLSGGKTRGGILAVGIITLALAWPAAGQAPLGNDTFSFQVYYVNPGFYPVVQAYVRTFDQNLDPIPSLNLMNIGIQVDGKNYDPALSFDPRTRRGMYGIETLQNRNEAFRTIFVWDCSLSMAGKPFADAKTAIEKYIQIKRPADQIAVIAIRDTTSGYQQVSAFEKDPTLLYQRMEDVKCDGQKTRLYDSVVAALELAASGSQGSINNTGAELAILNSIVAVSDGHDEGSAITKDVLVTKLASLKPPVPIYSLAYSNTPERQYFTNMEALSKATFGQYWTVAESQNFATMLQKIHQINRSDYVVTFRATAPVDGANHNFAIGIQWPSNSGRFQFRPAQFIAMDSPAILIGGKAKEVYQQLIDAYPDLSKAPSPAPAATPAPIPSTGQAGIPPITPPTPPVPVTGQVGAPSSAPVGGGSEGEASESTRRAPSGPDVLRLAAVGLGILILIVGIAIWVRMNASANRGSTSRSDRTSGGTKDQ